MNLYYTIIQCDIFPGWNYHTKEEKICARRWNQRKHFTQYNLPLKSLFDVSEVLMPFKTPNKGDIKGRK